MSREEIPVKSLVDEWVMGTVTCPKCGKQLRLIHRQVTGSNKILKHVVEEIPDEVRC